MNVVVFVVFGSFVFYKVVRIVYVVNFLVEKVLCKCSEDSFGVDVE